MSALDGLLAPLRLPERVIKALESLPDAAADLRAIRSELSQVREQTKPLAELLPALERLEQSLGAHLDSLQTTVRALEGNESHLNKTAQQLVRELSGMHETLGSLQDDVQSVTDRLPDPAEKRGPMQAAKDVLTGGAD